MKPRLLVALLLGGAALAAQQQPPPAETVIVSLINRPVGRETFSTSEENGKTTYRAELDLTERGGRLQVSSMLQVGLDLAPTAFSVKGKSYRFVNVDTTATIDGRMATVTNLGQAKSFEAPRRFYAAQTYAPLTARALMIRYWERNGRPDILPVIPGEPTRSVRIERRGVDRFNLNGKEIRLRRFSVDGVVWGRETVWLDDDDRFAAIVSRIHILPIEAVREDLQSLLPEMLTASIGDRMADLSNGFLRNPAVAEQSFVLSGATLIDGTGRAPIPDAVIVVRDRRIAAAGPRSSTPIPSGLPHLDAKGATVAPGLWDMHAHAAQVEWLSAYLAAGVTTFRDMGGEHAFLTAMRSYVAQGHGLGPRILLAGLVDGEGSGAFGALTASTPEQGRAIVDQYKKTGFQQMKLYSLLQPEVVTAITARAHELGMSVTGHVPTSLGLVKAIEAGMDQVAHLPINGDPQSPQNRATIDMLAKKKIVFDPTLPWNELLGHAPETALESFEPGFAHAPPALLDNYRSVKNDTDAATARNRVRASGAMVKALFDAGVPVVAGTDGALPGYSLLRSLELYVEAGMTPMQAIESATRVPAEAMGLASDTGTIEAGKRADMIVLNADPLASISNIRALRWVIANGRVMEPAKLWESAGFK